MNENKQFRKLSKLLTPVLAWLENKAKGEKFSFNMDAFHRDFLATDHKGRDCEVSVCIAGAIAAFRAKSDKPLKHYDVWKETKIKLVDEKIRYIEEYLEAKFPDYQYELDIIIHGNFDANPKQAAKMLRRFLETGEARW